MGDLNLPKVLWLNFEDFGLSPVGVLSNLEANLIDGLLNCYLQQLNSISIQFGVFLGLVFSNCVSDVAIAPSDIILLKQDRHHIA
jgi:hypothetical protein